MAESPEASARAPRRRWPVMLVSVLASLLVLELAYRVYLRAFASQDEYSKYMPYGEVSAHDRIYRGHHYLNYSLTEGYQSRDGKNRHNALGYRGKEIARAKPAGTYRILLLGGSTAYDTSIADWRKTWAEQLERILCDERGQRVEVVNCGCGGWTSWESLLDLELRGLELDPDLVVVYFGVNDVHARLVEPASYTGDNSGYAQQWHPDEALWQHFVLLRWMCTRLGFARKNTIGELAFHETVPEKRELEVLAANPPRYLERNTELVLDVCAARKVDVLLSTFAWCTTKRDYVAHEGYKRGLDETNAVTRAVAARRGAPLYDFKAQMPIDESFWADGRHNSEAGARKKAELFAAAILERFGPALVPHPASGGR